jgi:hypothetical protein
MNLTGPACGTAVANDSFYGNQVGLSLSCLCLANSGFEGVKIVSIFYNKRLPAIGSETGGTSSVNAKRVDPSSDILLSS